MSKRTQAVMDAEKRMPTTCGDLGRIERELRKDIADALAQAQISIDDLDRAELLADIDHCTKKWFGVIRDKITYPFREALNTACEDLLEATDE